MVSLAARLQHRAANRRSPPLPQPPPPMQVVQPPADRLPGALRTHQREVAAAAALSSSGVIAALLDEFTEPGMLVTVVSWSWLTQQLPATVVPSPACWSLW